MHRPTRDRSRPHARRAATWLAALALATLLACSPSAPLPDPDPDPDPQPPVARDDAYRVPSDAPFAAEAPGVLTNDDVAGGAVDPLDGATSAGGTIATSPSGAFSYEPEAGFVGADSFTYTVSNDDGASDPATVAIDVVASGWVDRAAIAAPASRPVAAVSDGTLFAFGGEASGTYSASVTAYDPDGDVWLGGFAPMPVAVSTACAAALDGDVYVLGGSSAATVASAHVQRYDAAADAWTLLATDPLPVGVRGHTCAVLDGSVYVFGGSPDTTPLEFLDAVWRFDPDATEGARWSTEAEPMPEAIGYAAAAVVDDAVYLAGDFYVGDTTTFDGARVYRFRPDGDGWVELPSLTTGRAGAGAWTSGPYLYVGGGGWTTYLTSVERYDTSLGTAGVWEPAPDLNTGRRSFGYATDPDEGRFYAVGGWNAAASDAVERAFLRGMRLP